MKSNSNFDEAGAPDLTLADLEPGGEAIVAQVDDTSAAGRRLLDLGLLPETRVRVVRRAPLGDPVELELRGFRLCLRRSDTARVRVRRLA